MFKTLVTTAAALFFAVAANATTLISDGGSYTLDAAGAAPFVGNIETTGTGGTFTATFSATPTKNGVMELSIIGAFVNLFDDLKVSWQTTGGTVLSEIDPIVAGTSTMTTLFDAVNSVQNLVFSWSDSTIPTGGPVGFDFAVSPVPVPAPVLMLGAAVAGLGGLRMRRKAA